MIVFLPKHQKTSFKIPSSPTSSSWLMNLMFEFSSKTQSCFFEKMSHKRQPQFILNKIRARQFLSQDLYQKTVEDEHWRNALRLALLHSSKVAEVTVMRVFFENTKKQLQNPQLSHKLFLAYESDV